ncbi:MAG: LEA type 2 family protein [Bacteroidales bacterium]|nr:LEA type 2 family protein [Bacteroidales bacterium]MCF8457154.1 LEA type 2 family protein [Bacteroidales bacterium]
MIKSRSLYIPLILIVVAFSFTSCFDLKPVELKEVKNVSIKSIEDKELKLEVELVISNPNSRTFKVRDADLSVSIGEVLLGKLSEVEAFTIAAHSVKSYDILLTVDLDDLKKNAKSLSKSLFKGGNTIHIKGYIKASSFPIYKKIEIDEKTKLSLLKSLFG